MLRYACRKCKAGIESPSYRAGRREACPVCGTVNTVPHVKKRGPMVFCIIGITCLLATAILVAYVIGSSNQPASMPAQARGDRFTGQPPAAPPYEPVQPRPQPRPAPSAHVSQPVSQPIPAPPRDPRDVTVRLVNQTGMALKLLLVDLPFRIEEQIPAGQTITLELKPTSYGFRARADDANGSYCGSEGAMILRTSEEWVFSTQYTDVGSPSLRWQKNRMPDAGGP